MTKDPVSYIILCSPSTQIHRPPEFTLFLNPQKSMGGSVKNQRPVSIKLHTKYPIDYPDR